MESQEDSLFVRPTLGSSIRWGEPDENGIPTSFTEGHRIRFLQFLDAGKPVGHDGDEDEMICCTMSVHDLEDMHDEYIAISYTWGPETPTKTIKIDGSLFHIRYNCWYALWQMKLHNLRQNYWIDSICINQEDLEEKSKQIFSMDTIYSKAALVAACIGHAGPDMELLQGDEKSFKEILPTKDRWPMYSHLASRSYFSRIWTVQECVCARKLDIFCGRGRISHELLQSRLEIPWRLGIPDGQLSELWEFLNDCTKQPPEYASGPKTSDAIPNLICRYNKRNCLDPRDKIYGLYSLMPIIAVFIPIDYSKTLLEVLLDYTGVHWKFDVPEDEWHYDTTSPRWEKDTQIAGDLLKMMLSIRMLCYDFARSSDAFRFDLLALLNKHLSGAWPESRDNRDFDPYYRNNRIRFDIYFRCFHRITAEDLANEILLQENEMMSLEDPDQSRICLRPCICCAGNFSLAEPPECFTDPTPKSIFDAYNEKTPKGQCRGLAVGTASSRLVFSVPSETSPGDILVNFHTMEADLNYQLFFVCTPSPSGAQEYEILGPATHMRSDDPRLPLVSATAICDFSSNTEWKKDLGCRVFLREEDWLVMSFLGQNMLEFVKLLSTRLIDKPGFMLDLADDSHLHSTEPCSVHNEP